MENNIILIKYKKENVLLEEKIKRMIIESKIPEPPIEMMNELEEKRLGVYMKHGNIGWDWRYKNLYQLTLEELCDLNNRIARCWREIDTEDVMDDFDKIDIVVEAE